MASHALSHQFGGHLLESKETGLTCEGNPAIFYTYTDLREFWTLDRISAVRRQAGIDTHAKDIRDRYLLVLSVLVHISTKVDQSLKSFDLFVSYRKDDTTLPWPAAPASLKDDTRIDDNLLEAFWHAQWQFCPVLMDPGLCLSDTKLLRHQIFPFTDKKMMGDSRLNREATMCNMGVLPRAHRHLGNNNQVPSRIVLKSYLNAAEAAYSREKKAYAALNDRSKNIVRCLGTYHWQSEDKQRTSVLILEYAEGGTLQDLFEKGHCPYESLDITAIWRGLVDLIKGLETLHEQDGLKAIHQDLKPSNILVFPAQGLKSEFSYLFKISDFGDCHVLNEHDSLNGHRAIDSRTTRTYGPPELHLSEDIRYNVGTKTDMWAAGCILVETAVWISFGEYGRRDFRKRRIEETSRLPNLKSTGRVDCFHDGEDVLEAVRDIPERIKLNGRRGDNISIGVVELALSNLLTDKGGRLGASELHARLSRVINENPRVGSADGGVRFLPELRSLQNVSTAHSPPQPFRSYNSLPESEPLNPVSSVPDFVSSPVASQLPSHPITLRSTLPVQPLATSSVENQRKPSPYPHVTIGDLIKWKSHGDSWASLSGWDAAKDQLKDRDFILIIDNSPSMQAHKDDVLDFVYHLSYLLKQLDPDGLEFCMTKNAHQKHVFKTSNDARAFVKSQFRPHKFTLNMEQVLEDALANVYASLPQLAPSRKGSLRNRLRKVKPFSILVLTDGVWDNSENGVCGADRPIEKCIKMMRENNVNKRDVALQFLRFGNNERGIQRLQYLDDDLIKKPENAGYDIVDHKSRNSGIWHILVGSLWEGIDGIC